MSATAGPDGDGAAEAIRAAAEHLYEACGLDEDDDLDPRDHAEVVARAFDSSDCDDFAHALALITGWPTVRATWRDREGHHAMVRAPNGRLLDVRGWRTRTDLARRYRSRALDVVGAQPAPNTLGWEFDDEGRDEALARIVSVIRALPHAPYCEPWFRALSSRPIPGADHPADQAPEPPGTRPGP